MSDPCPACGAEMAERLAPWLRHCRACGLWRSRLADNDRLQAGAALDETRRVAALEGLRRANHRRLLAALRAAGPLAGLRLLDVGCAYGWFLEEARAAGMDGVGLEPDVSIAAQAAARGLHVRVGYFPEDLGEDERFDVVVFNDVLEHLYELDAALGACRRLLDPGGRVAVSAPDSGGALFRLAGVLARCRRPALLERLWQKGYPSPHLSYFGRRSLPRLMARHGFALESSQPLPSLRWRGLWQRLHFDRRPSAASLVSFAGLAAALPVLVWLLPSDQLLHVYRRTA